jgi:L-galactose dehydrogenase
MTADHPATPAIREAAAAQVALCEREGVDVAHLANQYSIQRSGAVTTVIGTRKPSNVRAAVEAASTPIDEELLSTVLALRPPADQRTWPAGGWQG